MGQLGHLFLELLGSGDEQLPERPGIHEAQLRRRHERQHHVGVLGERGPRVGAQQLAAHAEMSDEDVAAVEPQEQVLPSTAGADQLAALGPGDELVGGVVPANGSRVGDLDLPDPLVGELLFDITPDGLDLG